MFIGFCQQTNTNLINKEKHERTAEAQCHHAVADIGRLTLKKDISSSIDPEQTDPTASELDLRNLGDDERANVLEAAKKEEIPGNLTDKLPRTLAKAMPLGLSILPKLPGFQRVFKFSMFD